MSEADKIVQISITRETKTPSRQGFGLPLITAYTTVFPERARLYSDTASMITDGFATTDAAYLAAAGEFAQNPAPPQVLIGRTENDEKRKIEIAPVTAGMLASYDYKIYVNGVPALYTTGAVPAVADICTGLAAAIDPDAWLTATAYTAGDHVTSDTAPVKIYKCITGGTSASAPTGTGSGIEDGKATWDYVGPKHAVTATSTATTVTVEGDAVSDVFTLYATVGPNDDWGFSQMVVKDITPTGSPGAVEDLTAIRAENDDWYGLVPTNTGAPVLTVLAVELETLNRQMFAQSVDTGILDTTVTNDIASVLNTAGYDRTNIIHHPKANLQYANARFSGMGLPTDPGTITWAFKELKGLDYVKYSDNQISAMKAKECNYYIDLKGNPSTLNGKVSGGDYIDVIRTVDWTEARMAEGVIGRMQNLPKIPFTDNGAAVIQGEVDAVLAEGVDREVFDNDPEVPTPTSSVPKVADVSVADRANRLLPDVTFGARVTGSIQGVVIAGTVSV
jgi:hypothetical protein